MKKLVYILLMFIIAFSACDPNEEIYDELDELKKPFSGTVDYTFTADDYATASENALKVVSGDDTLKAQAIESMEAFNSVCTAEDYVGSVLVEHFSEYNLGSRATVTYNNFLGGLEYLDAMSYELVADDYDAMGAPGQYDNFSYSDPPEDYLPDFLLDKYATAVAGDIKLIIYDYYSYGSVSTLADYYSFDGTEWSLLDLAGVELYILTNDDYDSMGAPGNYNNFSGSESPDDYLPTFLKIKFPYASAGDAKVAVYDYYEGGGVTNTYAKEYHFDGTVWTEYDAIEEVTNQFVHNGTEWLFDPTIVFTMGTADYQIIVEYVESEISADYLDSYGTAEFYYGASYYHNNFSIGEGYFEATEFATWDEAVLEAIGEILLPAKYPDAQLKVNGVDLYYKAIFDTYNNGARGKYAMKFQVTKAGPNPEFTYDEEFGLQEVE